MKKLSISKVIEFSRKSEKSKLAFLKQHNKPKQPSNGGGDYWASCISALGHAFKNNNNKFITEKIESLLGDLKNTPHKITKNMYKRNIDILYNFETFDFSKWIPIEQIEFLNKNSNYSIIDIAGIPIQVKPTHLFSFGEEEKNEIGAIVFVSKLDGYRKDELATFSDSLYRYLTTNYSDKYKVNPSLCIAVDSTNLNEITYSNIQNGEVKSILDKTLIEIKKVA